jgi:antitoxin PrlF
MIHSRVTSKAQVTVPREIRKLLGLETGDELIWSVDGGRVVVSRVSRSRDPFVNPFANFTEWADDLDSAYDDL